MFKKILPVIILGLFFSGCCEFMSTEVCEFQKTEKTAQKTFTFKYKVNTTGSFVEADRITAADIIKAFNEPYPNGEIKKLEIVGAQIQYARYPDNDAGLLHVAAGVVDNTTNVILINEIKDLPLYDVPSVPLLGIEGLNINQYLNGDGINELKRLFRDYVDLLNDDGFSVVLTGHGAPSGELVHFDLNILLTVAIVYEVCEWLPLGLGGEICN